MMVMLDLPFPVSVNALYRIVNGRPVLSPAYRKWRKDADKLFLAQKRTVIGKSGRIYGHYMIFITLDESRRRQDTDNSAKCVLDALQMWGVTGNDKLCDEVCIGWGYAPEGCRVSIYPTPTPRQSLALVRNGASNGQRQ